ncbi:MAG TPA: rRNA maturation RNase YbeY [Pseudobdellovibrionaceae bacterium]|nr:rRNA maturation RNase YbeY [Pseudobdellovibrionaceae bacterium]
MITNVIYKTEKLKTSQHWIQKTVRELIKLLEKSNIRNKSWLKKKEIVIAFLDRKEMKKINSQFRSKKKATDVLSFYSDDPDSIGELMICPEVISKQALDENISFQQELSLMILHGILHLLKYDHEVSLREEIIMFKIQNRIHSQLKAVGVY